MLEQGSGAKQACCLEPTSPHREMEDMLSCLESLMVNGICNNDMIIPMDSKDCHVVGMRPNHEGSTPPGHDASKSRRRVTVEDVQKVS